MIHTSNKLTNALIFLALSFFLSGCAGDMYVGSNPAGSRVEQAENVEPDRPDSTLEVTDPEMCLDQELTALDQTGVWNESFAPVSIDLEQSRLFDFPVVLNKQIEMYLNLFQNSQRNLFAGWLARSTIYMPIIEAELAESGLPHDLAYLAMIESGYNPLACSRSMAVGLWQFMEGTGEQYNLEINKFVDERRDVEKSTKAAVTFLADLYKEFGDWHLAVAAYNGGPGKIRNGLIKYNVDNFWELASKDYLALETKRYVPKLIAALIIAKQPDKYGFTNIAYYAPPRYDVLKVGPGMSFDAIALISESSPAEIRKLNHELRLDKTPLNISSYEIKIPAAKASIAKKNLTRLHSIVSTNYKTHKIGKGDTLAKICDLYGINTTTLLKANNLPKGKLAQGMNLRIPYDTVSYRLLPEGSAAALAVASRQNLILHQVKPGDTISKISKQYNVTPEMVASWNGLNRSHAIQAGQQLNLYVNQKKAVAVDDKKSLAFSDKGLKPLLKANRRKVHVTEANGSGLESASYKSYNVQDGDTLWTISQKFSASTSDIKKWNNLKNDLIHPGSVLKLKKG
ncbi:MAG: hypothetical protein ACD_75C02178G0005 [uncultured bacterium]|nr:MAG: hypothetical protein ACD_75C02178G0005 [uncultured bacterium]